MMPTLHQWLHRLLGAVLPASWADEALGDLSEDFLEWRRSDGAVVAWLRYGASSAGLILYSAIELSREVGHALAAAPAGMRRRLRRPLVPGVAALVLGPVLGITGAFGAALAGVAVGPLPHPQADRLVVVAHEGGPLSAAAQSLGLHARYEADAGSLEHLGLFGHRGSNVVYPVGARRVPVVRATAAALQAVDANAVLGRVFRPGDDRSSTAASVLLTREAWLRHWNGDSAVVGRALEIDGRSHEIVGVLSAGFRLPGPRPELVLSAGLSDEPGPLTAFAWSGSVGRLRDGAARSHLRDEIQAAFDRATLDDRRLAAVSHGEDRIAPRILSLRRWETRQALPLLAVGFGSSAVLLVLMGGSVLTLLVSTSAERTRQVRICRALGATRLRVSLQAGAESVAVLAAALVVGAAAAAVVARGLSGAVPLPVDSWTAPGAAALVAVLWGLVIALALATMRSTTSRTGRGSSGGHPRSGGGRWLLGAQVAGAVVLMSALASAARSSWTLAGRDLGFDPTGLTTFGVVLPEDPYGGDAARAIRLHESVTARLAALPGVEAVAHGLGVPLSHPGWADPWEVEGLEERDRPPRSHHYRTVSRGYFDALGIPLQEGRTFRADEARDGSPSVVVNEAFARRYWTEPGSALGQRVRRAGHSRWSSIVGVVGNTADQGVAEAPTPMIYQPFTALAPPAELFVVQYVVRGTTAADTVAATARAHLAELDARVPAFAFDTGEAAVRRDLRDERLSLVLLAGAAGVGLLATALGLGGLVLLVTLGRSREISVRKALGGRDGELRWLSVRPMRTPVLAGTMAGLALVASGLRVPAALVHGLDSWRDTGVALLLILPILLAAAYLGSRHVVRIDPSRALRD